MQNTACLKKRLYLAAVSVLVVGLITALLIYLTAEDLSDSSLITDFKGSKSYRHELEATGGKAILLASELANWFSALWQGKVLAKTIAGLSLVIAALIALLAHHLQTDDKPGVDD